MLLDAASTQAQLDELAARRAAGEPLEHVVGWADLCGLRILVEPGVFVPRRRTEALVRTAVSLAPQPPAPEAPPGHARPRPLPKGSKPTRRHDALVLVDLCCGSGALGVAVVAGVGSRPVELHAADVDPAAVRCARRNVEPIGGQVHLGDLDAPLPEELRGRVDLLLANVPYVPSSEIRLLPTEAREHEALVALDGGPDGLDVLRRVAAVAPSWLARGGHVLVETAEGQAPDAVRAFVRAGLVAWAVHHPEARATVVVAHKPGSAG